MFKDGGELSNRLAPVLFALFSLDQWERIEVFKQRVVQSEGHFAKIMDGIWRTVRGPEWVWEAYGSVVTGRDLHKGSFSGDGEKWTYLRAV